MSASQVVVDQAASVIVLRPGHAVFEVLMVERPDRGFFGGIHVFPGGKVDDVDRSALAREAVSGEGADHEYRSAALRELAEETGIAVLEGGTIEGPAARDADLFRSIVEQNEQFAGARLVLVSRWVTPEGAPRRFDTWFYLLAVNKPPAIRLDPHELVGYEWSTPADALEKHQNGRWPMILPTLAHLRWLAKRPSIDDALESAQGADGRTLIRPRRMEDRSILPIHLPGDQD